MKKKIREKTAKLQLNREVIRALTKHELLLVEAGGCTAGSVVSSIIPPDAETSC